MSRPAHAERTPADELDPLWRRAQGRRRAAFSHETLRFRSATSHVAVRLSSHGARGINPATERGRARRGRPASSLADGRSRRDRNGGDGLRGGRDSRFDARPRGRHACSRHDHGAVYDSRLGSCACGDRVGLGWRFRQQQQQLHPDAPRAFDSELGPGGRLRWLVSSPVSSSLRALGSTALVATTTPGELPVARALLVRSLRALDLACSRFRDDSELTAVNSAAGAPVAASLLLRDTVRAAIRVAATTGGLVDPTVGRALRLAGYDRTFMRVRLREGSLVRPVFERAGRWQEIELDDEAGTVRVPAGVELDLGATAKALAADTIAQAAAVATGCGVLVSIGGDIAVAGEPPTAGWIVGIDDDHATPPDQVAMRVSVSAGGLASSGTRVRRWGTAAGELHHILDPRTGAPAAGPWTTVSVAADSCLDANAASTAAVVLGEAAPAWLSDRKLPSRLARADGRVLAVAGWPEEQAA